MRLEGQAGRGGLRVAVGVVVGGVHVAHLEGAADGQVGVFRQVGGDPGGEAVRVTVVAALWRVGGAVEVAVKVHLFAGVVFVHVFAIAHDLVDAVFHAVDASGHGVLGDADTVT